MPVAMNRSLAYRLTVAVLVLSLALGAVATAGLFALQYREALAAVEAELDRIGLVDVPGVAADLWAMDRERLQIDLEAICQHPNMTRAWVEVGGQTVLAAGAALPGRAIDRSYPLRHSRGGRALELGTLHVQAGLSGLTRELLATMIVRFAFQTGQILVVAFCMLALFRWLVTNRLSALEKHLARLGAGDLDASLVLPRSRIFAGEDELDRVADAAGDMAAGLRAAFGEQARIAREWQSTFDASNDAIWILDAEHRVVRSNKTAERIFRRSGGEMLGEHCFAIVHGTKAPHPQCPVVRARASHRRETMELQADEQWFEVVADPLLDAAGRYVGAVHVVVDITERKRAEESARKSEEIFSHFLENSPVYVFFKDENIRSLRLSKNYETLLGRPLSELLGKNMDELFPSELAKSMIADDLRVLREGRMVTVEEAFNGRAYTTIKFPILEKDGSRYLAGYTIDITERKRAEESLVRLNRQHELILDSAAEGILGLDLQGNHTFVNKAAARMLGYEAEELIGRNGHDAWHHTGADGGHCPPEACQIQGAFRDGAARRSASEVFWRKDGTSFPVEYASTPSREEGRLVGAVVTFSDITERLQGAEDRARLEDQLRQSQKVEAIGRLAGGVAHDFNNLTAIVLGYGELLLGRMRQDDPLRKHAEQIVAAGQRSAALTRQLLAFSRRQTLQPEVLDLNALLRNLEKMLGRLIGEDIRLELVLAPGLGSVTADPGQLEQVVTNLVLNARDAMPRGGRLTLESADVEIDEVYAHGHESVVPGRYVLLALTDTGCGMDKAAMARLFEPFYTTKERGKGTGLGLATVYGIVKQSGGYIWASSEPGRGTTFKIYLPRTDARPEAKTAESGGEIPRGRGERILLVEDEAPLRELCETVLTRLGYRVSGAGSGPEALALARELDCAPDLILTDVIMPGMSGGELAKRLRDRWPALRVLFMSGYPDEALAPHGVLAPDTGFIQKPFTERAIAAKLRGALGAASAAGRPGRRVLMIDDDEQFRELVRLFCVKRGHAFTGVDSVAGALAALAAQPFDVLLVDVNIPGTSGERVLREIRAAGHIPPAIVLTGDVASADMSLLGPLGVVRAVGKSSDGEPLLRAIEAAASAPPAP